MPQTLHGRFLLGRFHSDEEVQKKVRDAEGNATGEVVPVKGFRKIVLDQDHTDFQLSATYSLVDFATQSAPAIVQQLEEGGFQQGELVAVRISSKPAGNGSDYINDTALAITRLGPAPKA